MTIYNFIKIIDLAKSEKLSRNFSHAGGSSTSW